MVNSSVVVVSTLGLFFALCAPLGYQCKVADDSCGIVKILTSALRALVQLVFADEAAVVAKRVWNIEGEVVASS